MVNERAAKEVLCLAFRAARFGEAVFERAVREYLKNRGNLPEHHGKMKLKDLMQLDQGAKMNEIAPDAVKGFQRIAKKYNVDFAIARDKGQEPPMFQVFFKARDEDVIMKAFNEYVNSREKKKDRVPFVKKLGKAQDRADIINAAKEVKEKTKVMDKALG